jgi:hypothetical protein
MVCQGELDNGSGTIINNGTMDFDGGITNTATIMRRQTAGEAIASFFVLLNYKNIY